MLLHQMTIYSASKYCSKIKTRKQSPELDILVSIATLQQRLHQHERNLQSASVGSLDR